MAEEKEQVAQVSVKDFLRKHEPEKKEVKVGDFKAPFIIRELTNAENEQLRENATRRTKNRQGQIVVNVDADKYAHSVITSSLIQPDLENKEIQEFYGTLADPYGTLERMLTVSELNKLAQAVTDLSGVSDNMDEEVEKAKN